jgi:catechol 2,3-dioxygenase-like lactoylglutathione lyase family enzyme
MQLEGIDHVALAVRDVERSAEWYAAVLGLERLHQGMWNGIPVFIGKGKTAIALFPGRSNDSKPATHTGRIDPPMEWIRPVVKMLHLAFRADRKNFLAAQEELLRGRIKFEFQDHEISHSIYFRDPDGHELEITTYELK